jgi:Phycobilisome protein
MFDAFTKVVSQADARGEFLATSQLDALSSMVGEGSKRLDAVNRITGNASTIVANAARAVMLTPTVVWQLAYATWKSSCAMSPTQLSQAMPAF